MRQDIIHDPAKISWILNQCNILHLGLTNNHGAYVVPVHYGFIQQNDGNFIIYVHGTGDGEKAAALDAGQPIGFEVDHGHENLVYTPPSPEEFDPSFMSVIGNGLPERINNPQAKANALKAIIHHYMAKSPVAILPEEIKEIHVWQIKVSNITGRVGNPTKSQQQALHLDQPLHRGKHYDENGGLLYDDFTDQPENNDEQSDASTGASSTDN
ncbi:pyridoxamine 5'-phosphate oxidase family protein [uncultured Limosilactobacillus sp.]|uniref:pyridoxamine 5'-phosphate oxidase family protein n=1 Tax=uncultured Limosilactobacillus sp. TaxID=2837629 RepID=UPI002600BD5F|nr:pyridoxamine 5'-phosphate oxidase family protein [uncultured Limosilactobacillus sp.]